MQLLLKLALAGTSLSSSASATNYRRRDDTVASASSKCAADLASLTESRSPPPTLAPEFSTWLVTVSGVRAGVDVQTDETVDIAALCTSSARNRQAREEAVERERDEGLRRMYKEYEREWREWKERLKPEARRLAGECKGVNDEVAGGVLYAVAGGFGECTEALGLRFAVTTTRGDGEEVSTTAGNAGQGVETMRVSTGGGVVETGCVMGVLGVVGVVVGVVGGVVEGQLGFEGRGDGLMMGVEGG